jgi:hypothetical protein
METQLTPTTGPGSNFPVLWRDPHSVPPAELKRSIESLEAACQQNPQSADLQTCLGMAYAMNFEIYKSMDALEAAVRLQPAHFYSQLKYAELHYRLRALIKAEKEALRALELATDGWELSLARKQLQEIRTLMRAGTQKPEWTKPLARPAVCLAALTILFSLAVYLR